MTQKVWIDANDVIRIITGDIRKQAEEMIQKVIAGELVLYLTPLAVAKCCWILSDHSESEPKEIADALLTFTNFGGVETEEKELVQQALRDYAEKNVEFIDSFIAAYAKANPSEGVDTWEKYLERLGVQFDGQED